MNVYLTVFIDSDLESDVTWKTTCWRNLLFSSDYFCVH